MGIGICPTIRDEDKVLTRSFAPIRRLARGSRPQRVLTCGDATRLSAKSLRQNCFAPTNTPTAKTLPAFLSACPHPRWSVLNLVFIQLRCCCASQSERSEFAPLFAVLFCSAPPLGCGSVYVLGGSFARFCVSENVRVPLRYSGQPLRRKIIASRSPNTPWFCLSNLHSTCYIL